MISDTLFDAASEIRRYRSDFTDVYKEDWPEMDQLLALMDKIRIELDKSPSQIIEEATLRILN